MIDISKTVAPRSDQLNSDDLIAGPRTITVTSVRLVAEDQPVAIHYAGDDGKPYKPCKSMRRVLVRAWGADASTYAGRSMTLYLDETVRFGATAVGGIRISHLSNISGPMTMALTATRAVKKAFTVKPLASTQAANPAQYEPDDCTKEWLADIDAAESIADLKTVFGTAYKACRSKAEKDAFKAAYDARKAALTSQEQAA